MCVDWGEQAENNDCCETLQNLGNLEKMGTPLALKYPGNWSSQLLDPSA